MRPLLRCLALTLALAFGLPPGVAAADAVLRIAANPNLSPLELINNFGPLATALEKELGRKVELTSGRDYDHTIQLLKSGQVDVAGTGAFGYVTARDDFGAKLVVRYVEEGGDSYRALIITRTDSGITSLQDLKGKRFAFTDPKSTSGYLLPLLGLIEHGVERKDLGRVDFVKKQPNAAIAVFTRQADAGAIADNQLTDKYGVRLGEIRVLWRSISVPHGVWMARPDMPDDEVRRLAAAMLAVSANPAVRPFFNNSSVKGFTAGSDSDFNAVREARRQLQQLEAQGRQ